jgi:PKD repeat protein
VASDVSLSDIRNYVYTESCYSGLTGDNIIIGIWESAGNDYNAHKVNATLSEFQNRVTVIEDFGNVSPHATSVALIIGSNPGNDNNRGMAPDIEMYSYKDTAAATEMSNSGLQLSSHSYNLGGWGEYENFLEMGSRRFDKVIKDNNMITFVAAGNEFYNKENDTGSGYGSVLSPATAKNCISVGATNNSQFDELADFSGAGPTDDGRIKPEIVAPGYRIDLDPNPYPDQEPISGTSFACPVVSGSAALVLEQWNSQYTETMLPSTMKALLVHTANNDGDGPTFRSGYGMLDTQEAVDLVELDDTEQNTIIQDFSTFSNGDNFTDIFFTVPTNTAELRVTLAWSDVEGLKSNTTPLKNDLDLVVTGPGGQTYEPWILDPDHPENEATTGTDDLNPLEMVQIEDPDVGTYTITVSGSIDDPSQSFSLVTSTKSKVYNGSDIALVIDSSGSMRSTDPHDLRKIAAKIFVDLASDDDHIAIIDFDFYGEVRTSLCNVGDNRESLKSSINAIDSAGKTNIGDGLNQAYDQLCGNSGADAVPSHSKAAILLTDGGQSPCVSFAQNGECIPGLSPTSVTPLYVSKGWPIYTIAHSDIANEDLMRNIAQDTGGLYYKTKASIWIADTYLRIRNAISDIYLIHIKKDTISSGDSIERIFTIDPSIVSYEIIFINVEAESEIYETVLAENVLLNESQTANGLDYVESKDSALLSSQNNLNFTLYYPNGTQVFLNSSSSTGTDNPDIIHISCDDYEVYKIQNQLSGNWTYNITSQSNETLDYSLLMNANTSMKLEVDTDKKNYCTGEHVEINVRLHDENVGIENASINGSITYPDLTTYNISLTEIGNGYYEGTILNISQQGTYEIWLKSEKDNLIRHQFTNFYFEDIEVNFTADTTFGLLPLTVNFTDLSTGGSQWKWDVDDDVDIDYLTQNVCHTYETPGEYNVSLSAGNEGSYINMTKIWLIHVFDLDGVVNGKFETGDLYGWTVATGGSGPDYDQDYEVAEDHNHTGNYGCELSISCSLYGESYISLTQSVNLTNVDAINVSHKLTDYYSNAGDRPAQIQFYVDDNKSISYLLYNNWKQDSFDVSDYYGKHNISIELYTGCGQMVTHEAQVDIDDIILVPGDWNPWNDLDSEDGALISTLELKEALHYWINNLTLSTGGEVTTPRIKYLIHCWINDEICEDSSEEKVAKSSQKSMALITANRTISNDTVTPDSTFMVTVGLTPDQSVEALLLDEEYPDGWNITHVGNDGSSFKNLTDEWIWASTISGSESCTVTYNVTVPANLTGGMYNISGFASAYEVNETEVSGDYDVYVMDDWNPWNDWDSDEGAYITQTEVNEAMNCWQYETPAPNTSASINLGRLFAVITYYQNGTEMPTGAAE